MRVNVDNLLDTSFKFAAGVATGLGIAGGVTGNPDVLGLATATGASTGLIYLAVGGLREAARTRKATPPTSTFG